MSPDTLAAGVFGIAGAVVGTLLGLFGERWARTLGKVRCEIKWLSARGAGSRPNVEVQERQLEVTFLNRKDVPVTVWDMQVVFYKEGKPLGEEERPSTRLVDANVPGGRGPLDLVTLPPRVHVKQTISVEPGHNEHVKQRAVEAADRVEFQVSIEGARNITMALAPWNELTPQTEKNF
jgi:hypothetical protein